MSQHLAQRFSILLMVAAAALGLFGLGSLLMVWHTGVHGRLYRDIYQAQELISRLEPPPLFVVEALLLGHQQLLLTPGDTHTVQQIEGRLQELYAAHREKTVLWRRLMQDHPAQPLVEEAISTGSGSGMWRVLQQQILPALAAGEVEQAQAALAALIPVFTAHRQEVEAVIAAMQVQRHRAEAQAQRQQRTLSLGLGTLLLIAFGCGLGLLRIRRLHGLELSAYRDHLEQLVVERTSDLEQASHAAEMLTQEAEARRQEAEQALSHAHSMQQSLTLAKEDAETANRAKSDFLARMSHEIRTPLNAVLGYSQLMARDASLGQQQRQAVSVINRSGEHLLALINDILEMSRIESGRANAEREDFHLHDLLDGLKSLFLLSARDKGLELVLTLSNTVPPYAHSDPRRLRQILANLISNAIKFSSLGRITISADYDSDQQLFTVAVQDCGPGMSTEEQAQLFQPFVQVGQGRVRGDGSGLGLAISRGLCALLGGHLQLRSAPGEGSTFTVSLPLQRADGPGEDTHAAPLGLICSPGSPLPRILIAEDHRDSRELLQRHLEDLGLEVASANHGAEAVARCREWQPQLIWMDIDMPVLDGIAATTEIRRSDMPQPIIIALTAAAFIEDRQRFLDAGCNDVAHKPYRIGILCRLMERHLGLHFRWPEAAAAGPAPSSVSVPEALGKQPLAWRRDLHAALLTGDVERAQALLADCDQADLRLELSGLIEQLAIERLLQVLEAAEAVQ